MREMRSDRHALAVFSRWQPNQTLLASFYVSLIDTRFLIMDHFKSPVQQNLLRVHLQELI